MHKLYLYCFGNQKNIEQLAENFLDFKDFWSFMKFVSLKIEISITSSIMTQVHVSKLIAILKYLRLPFSHPNPQGSCIKNLCLHKLLQQLANSLILHNKFLVSHSQTNLLASCLSRLRSGQCINCRTANRLFSLGANFPEFYKWACYSGNSILACYMKFNCGSLLQKLARTQLCPDGL